MFLLSHQESTREAYARDLADWLPNLEAISIDPLNQH